MLKEKIGINAGLIYLSLESGEKSLKAVKKATKLIEKDLNMALGWLARENNLEIYELEGELYLRLI